MPLPSPSLLLNDLKIAMSLLTRLPVPRADWDDTGRPPAQAAWAYPVAGGVVAFLAALLAMIALWLGSPAAVAALIFLSALMLATGAMHEDGLADCADGFWGGWDRARRLEIMKDSAIGTYGVLALIVITALRWVIYADLIASGAFAALLLAPLLARAAMVHVMSSTPLARAGGLSDTTGRPDNRVMFAALGIAVVAAVLICGLASIWVLASAAIAAFAVRAVAMAKIGGQTGDVLGATQQICEAAVLCALVSVL